MSLPLPDPLSEVKIIIVGVVFAVLIGLIGYLAYTKNSVETQLAQAQTDIVSLTSANEDWKSKTEQVNAAIASEQAAEKLRADEAAKAIADAQKIADSYSNEALTLAKATPSGDDCAATKKLTDSYFESKK